MQTITRMFARAGGLPINDKAVRVEFDIDVGPNTYKVRSKRSIKNNGEASVFCPWSLKDALSLIESGNWEEIIPSPNFKDIPANSEDAW